MNHLTARYMANPDAYNQRLFIEKYPNFNPRARAPDDVDSECNGKDLSHLHAACDNCERYLVELYMMYGVSLAYVNRDDHYWTPLMYACTGYLFDTHVDINERAEFVSWLLEDPECLATINTRDDRGNTALHYACAAMSVHAEYALYLPIVIALLAHGSDPTMRNNKGEAIYDMCNSKQVSALKIVVAGEWRPRRHNMYPHSYRLAMKTLVMLAKIRSVQY